MSIAKSRLTLNFLKMWIFHQFFLKYTCIIINLYKKNLCLHAIDFFNACLFTIFKIIKVFYKTLTSTVNNFFIYKVNIFNTDNLFWKIYWFWKIARRQTFYELIDNIINTSRLGAPRGFVSLDKQFILGVFLIGQRT